VARIRTIKPSFWSSGTVAKLGFEARLLAVGLISMADDDGRFLCTTAAVMGHVFPNDEELPKVKVRRWLDQIRTSGMVHEYEVDGIRYGVFPEWHEHQVINRYTPSHLPEPDVSCSPRCPKRKGVDQ